MCGKTDANDRFADFCSPLHRQLCLGAVYGTKPAYAGVGEG